MTLTKQWLWPLIHLFCPHYCVVCGARLQEEEQALCADCLKKLPRTLYYLQKDSLVEKLFWGKFPVERATAFFHYQRGGAYAKIVHLLKYEGRSDIGVAMGRLMARELVPSGFFEGVDMLVPVPLHPDRQRERGYNQSERLAAGIQEVTGIEVHSEVLMRQKSTDTQTHKDAQQRYENMRGVFRLNNPASSLQGKHILLIDDVLTTSATLTACADVLKDIPDIRISILALALAGH